MNKYFKQYKWSNIFTMLKNQKKDPLICNDDFKDRLVVITGATSGIGLETAKKYASMGANILSVSRSKEKSENLKSLIESDYSVNCDYILADFTSLDDIHEAGKTLSNLLEDIDVLIHNAGTYVTKRVETKDGLEQVFQTNYLSTFILNYYLVDKFKKQNKGRIIYVNSEAHRFAAWGIYQDDLNWKKHKYKGIKGYGFAKMEQLLSMIKFSDLYKDSNVTINAMHPGNVKTNSGQTNGKIYKLFKKVIVDRKARPISISSEALYYLGVSKDIDGVTGKFFNLTTLEEPAPPALDKEEADILWDSSLELGRLK